MPAPDKHIPSVKMDLHGDEAVLRTPVDSGDLLLIIEHAREKIAYTHVSVLRAGARPFWVVSERDGTFYTRLWIGAPMVSPTTCEILSTSLAQVHDLLPRGLRRVPHDALYPLILEKWASASMTTPRPERPLRLLPSTVASVVGALICEAYENGVCPLPEGWQLAASQLSESLGVADTAYGMAVHMQRNYGWANTHAVVVVLDEILHEMVELLFNLQETWELENITPLPALSPGTPIRTKQGLTGITAGIYGYGLAQYFLGVELPDGRRVTQAVNIEDVTPL